MAWDYPLRCRRSRMWSSPPSTDENIPEDLWSDILKSLPVKRLVTVQSVCKSWKALISSSAFVKIHQSITLASRLEFFDVGLLSCSCRIRHGGEGPDTNSFNISFTPLKFPEIPSYNLAICYPGIVHGVVMLYYTAMNKVMMTLWNPAIRKHVAIPWPLLLSPWNKLPRIEGFGLDPQTNDFKVVMSRMEGYYDVLSVRDGVWRMDCPSTLLDSSSAMCTQWTGCFLNGTIYWITTRATDYDDNGHFGLLLFDCAREEFTTMDLPPQLVSNQIAPHMLLILGSRLALIERLLVPDDDDIICQLWTMQDDEKGGSTTWTRLGTSNVGDDIYSGRFVLTPLAEPNHDYARFRLTQFHRGSYYDFQETMMLADIGNPDM